MRDPRRRGPGAVMGLAGLVAALSLTVLSLTAGCGGSDSRAPGGPDVVVDTLASGVVRVMSGTAGAWDEDAGWSLVEELSLGSASAEGPELFGNVAALAVDDRGRILVLDAQVAELRIFGSDGSHLRTVGRRGGGPGEFRTPVGLAAHPAGGYWVVDPANGRYTVLDPEGEVVTSFPRASGYFAWPFPVGFDLAGRMHDLGSSEEIVALTDQAQPVDTFAIPTVETRRINVIRADGAMTMSIVAPFSPRHHWRFDPRGYLWSGMSDSLRFVQQTLAGDTVRIVQREHQPVPVSRAEADSAQSAIREMIAESAGADAQVEGDFAPPAARPAFEAFHLDDDGRLWVEPSRARGAPRSLLVFDPEGRYLGSVRIPEGFEMLNVIPVFREGTVTALVTNEEGVPTVVRYRVVKGE